MLGIKEARIGNTVGDIGHAIQTHVETHGYSVVKGLVVTAWVAHVGRPADSQLR
jgi:methionine aminopeptidase